MTNSPTPSAGRSGDDGAHSDDAVGRLAPIPGLATFAGETAGVCGPDGCVVPDPDQGTSRSVSSPGAQATSQR